MGLTRILVAIDPSSPSTVARRIGTLLADRSGASLALVQVCPPGVPEHQEADSSRPRSGTTPLTFRRVGVPGVEIARCAEEWRADLVVLGRSNRVPKLGSTADMVLRRRHGPTLLIPCHVSGFGRILYALDGTERGLRILEADGQLTGLTGAKAMAVCVLPPDSVHGGMGDGWAHPRQTRVERAMAERPDLGGPASLTIRSGEPVSEVLRHVAETTADLLVLGLRQGGPRGDPGSGHVARDLLHSVPTAILTIPI